VAAVNEAAPSERSGLRYVDPAAGGLAKLTGEEREALEKVNAKIAGSRTVEEVIDFLFETTRGVCPCDRIALAFVEEDGRRVVAHYARAAYEPLLLRKGYAEDLAGSSLEAVLAGGTPRIINDLEAHLAAHPKSVSTRVIVREGIRSSMTCPLEVDGRSVGLLFRSSRRPNAYDERQVALHMAVAERIGQIVEKTIRIEQLAAATRAYAEMLGFVAHELKSPLASIVLDARVLVDGYLGELAPAQRDKAARVIAQAEHLIGLVREYLDLARIEGKGLAASFRAGVDFGADVVTPSLDMVRPQIEERRARVSTSAAGEPILVECDPELMRIAIVNLIGNAVKYGNEGGAVRVSFEAREGRLCAAVWNEGPGFGESERPRLFRRFSRLASPELARRKGTGVGLYTTWRIVQLHGGRIDAASEEGKWAEFSFEIPLKQGARDTAPEATGDA
jgi:signal transduction histidine kinase